MQPQNSSPRALIGYLSCWLGDECSRRPPPQRFVGPMSIAAASNEKSPGKPKRSKRQAQCLVSDIIDLAQSSLAVMVAHFVRYGCPGNKFRTLREGLMR